MSNQEPVVSVIMATYIRDELHHLQMAVESILTQTYTAFELIIVVDGPVAEDNLQYLLALEKLNKAIVIILKKNVGPARARNIGIRSSSGKYIAVMDADDISVARRFEIQVEFIERSGADFTSSWLEIIDTNGEVVGARRIPLTNKYIKMLSVIRCPMHNPSLLCSANLLRNYAYDESLRVSEDYDLWVRLLAAGYTAANTPLMLVQYRQDMTNLNRRTGLNYFKSDIGVKIKSLQIFPFILRIFLIIPIVATSLLRLLPLKLFTLAYRLKARIF